MKILNTLKQKARKLKSEAQVLIVVYGDKRTPLIAKVLIAITVGYLMSPIDLIPDFIPVLGLLDDLIIVPLLITLSIKLIPEQVLSDARITVKSQQGAFKKKNWLFAAMIIMTWIFLFLPAFRNFKYLWQKK